MKKMDMIYCDDEGFYKVHDSALRHFILTKTYLVHQVQ